MPEFKPCPFCGYPHIGESTTDPDVFCYNCCATAPRALWNTRPAEDALAARVAGLEKTLRKVPMEGLDLLIRIAEMAALADVTGENAMDYLGIMGREWKKIYTRIVSQRASEILHVPICPNSYSGLIETIEREFVREIEWRDRRIAQLEGRGHE